MSKMLSKFEYIAVIALIVAGTAYAQPQAPATTSSLSLTASLLTQPPSATEFANKGRAILSKVDNDEAELPEGLFAARILFGEGIRKADGELLVGLAEEITKRASAQIEAHSSDDTAPSQDVFAISRELIETLANLGAHRELITYYEAHFAPHEACYRTFPGFGNTIGYVLGAYYGVGRSDYAHELAERLLSDQVIPLSEQAAIAIGAANNLVSKAKIADAMILYRFAIVAAPKSTIAAQAYYWVALQALVDSNDGAATAAAVELATQGITALSAPVLAWEEELETRLIEIKNSPRALTGRNAQDLELVIRR